MHCSCLCLIWCLELQINWVRFCVCFWNHQKVNLRLIDSLTVYSFHCFVIYSLPSASTFLCVYLNCYGFRLIKGNCLKSSQMAEPFRSVLVAVFGRWSLVLEGWYGFISLIQCLFEQTWWSKCVQFCSDVTTKLWWVTAVHQIERQRGQRKRNGSENDIFLMHIVEEHWNSMNMCREITVFLQK